MGSGVESQVDRIERLASQVLEGWTARVFRTRLQPVQLAKRSIQAMESHKTISLQKTFVPNSYVISLSGEDFAQFEPYRRSLERDIAETLLGAARDRGFTLLAFPSVEIERSEEVGRGEVRVSCALVDASGDEVAPGAEELGSVEAGNTMILDRDALLKDRPRAPKGHLDVPQERRRIPLGPEPITIGRDPDNDLVLDDRRVSRRHAEIRLRLGRYTLYDLQSTNGTFVNGRRVAEIALSDGDRIAIGGTEVVVAQESG